jgi:uncharacterized protein YdaU (DUF1376 family)
MNRPPAFQLYPKDFISDINVQAMTDEQVGKYFKLLCHCWIEDGIEIGSPLVEGWFNQHPSIAKCFYEKDGRYRNKRLDEERQKQINWRNKSRTGGLHSVENKRLLKGGSTVVKPSPKGGDALQSSSSVSSKKEYGHFESFWSKYPRKIGKADAVKALAVVLKSSPIEEVLSAVDGYVKDISRLNTEPQYIKHPATFLKSERWRDYLPGAESTLAPPKPDPMAETLAMIRKTS